MTTIRKKKVAKKTTKKKVAKKKSMDLEALLGELQEDEVTIMGAGEEDNTPYQIRFRNEALQAISDGVGGGRMFEIAGESQTGKSFLLYEIMKGFVDAEGIVILFDTENAFQPRFARRIGLKSGQNFLYSKINDIEEVFRLARKLINRIRKKDKNIPILVAIDSFAGMQHPEHKKNIENEKGQKGFASMQKNALMSFHLQDFCPDYLGKKGATLGLVNQVRTDNTVMFGDNTYTLAETVIRYWCDLRLRGKHGRKSREEVDSTKANKQRRIKGFYATWEATKTRGVESHEKIELFVQYAKGLSRYSGVAELLVNRGLAKIVKVKKQVQGAKRKVTKSFNALQDVETGKKFMKVSSYLEAFPDRLQPKYIDVVPEGEDLDYDGLEDLN